MKKDSALTVISITTFSDIRHHADNVLMMHSSRPCGFVQLSHVYETNVRSSLVRSSYVSLKLFFISDLFGLITYVSFIYKNITTYCIIQKF
jgi:hypothetical protein